MSDGFYFTLIVTINHEQLSGYGSIILTLLRVYFIRIIVPFKGKVSIYIYMTHFAKVCQNLHSQDQLYLIEYYLVYYVADLILI